MKKLKRRAAISAAVFAMLLIATAVCVFIQRDAPRAMSAGSTVISAPQTDPATQFRTQREELRNRQIGQLNEIIHDDSTDSETVNLARRQLLSLMERQETEQRLEGILGMRGFQDVLVTVSDASVNVILREGLPTRQESAVILDLILRETGVTAGNVKILTINT